jgi:pimeloyl-ACP methyl ester carboxylesterase
MPIAKLKSGLDIYYEIHGQGEPVLLLMGTGADHTFWGPQIGPYSSRYRLIVIDARGTGRSCRPSDWQNTTARAMAVDAAQLLDCLQIDKVHLGGMSIGGAVAQEFALAYPDRLLSLALHCTWAKSDEWFIRAIETIEYPAARDDVHAYLRFALMWVLSPRFLAEKPKDVEQITRTYIDDNPHPPSREGILGHTNADKLHDVLDRLPKIKARTLVTAGEMDWLVPPRYSEVVAKKIPNARYHLFKGDFASHCACVEMADEWNRVTMDFISGKDVGVVLR